MNKWVQKSFSSDALAPTFNPAFPTIPIGVFSPLRGSRPFRLAPHSGYFGLNYSWSRWYGSLTGTFVGRRDDSDFLSDEFGGSTMLRSLQIYTAMGNVLSQHYSEVFGYPALPFTFRAGIKLTFGGESWRLK